ncbi:MAG: WXG100 family type VII secretion target [Firmicutes bacterium]|nr:WXG100 family type VII secretion target [Bacillota bacterium]
MNFTVDPPVLHAAAQKFTELSQEYTAVYTRLLNAAQTMGDAWNAADNLAFVEQINGFCEELKSMAAHMDVAAQTLTQQATNYETTRDNNTAGVKQLMN